MKKIISIILVFLLLLSSSGISYAQHFCGNYLAKATVTIGHTDLHCGMNMEPISCETKTDGHTEVSKRDCCENHFSKIEIDDDYNSYNFELKIDNNFIATFAIPFIERFSESTNKLASFVNYKPPLPDKDIPVLYQLFLI